MVSHCPDCKPSSGGCPLAIAPDWQSKFTQSKMMTSIDVTFHCTNGDRRENTADFWPIAVQLTYPLGDDGRQTSNAKHSGHFHPPKGIQPGNLRKPIGDRHRIFPFISPSCGKIGHRIRLFLSQKKL
ncbi:hypothetical protein [Phormidium sp. CCY1219]|uniref:hypothetical protein n=1 Tax=Phormidium sp. CCY1219 TaxID=2886104 RepID=UPI002D1EF535|nr:hypothetical protein [Phormidium sp. CCY1219]MEB3830667.1 hypothetical protein [Phormidium sp. CCY1219]